MPDFRRIHGGIGPSRAVYLLPIQGLTNGNVIPSRGFWFPVAPREYGKAGASNWNTNRIAGLGEVAHRGGTNLEVIEIDSFFPGEYNPALCRSLRSEQDYYEPDIACRLLERVRDEQLIFQLNIGTEIMHETVRLTEFAWTETAGRPNDRGFSCKFETWVSQDIARRGEVILPPIPKAYRLREGEDLEDAALRIYGDVKQASKIAAANGIPATVRTVGTNVRTVGTTTRALGASPIVGVPNIGGPGVPLPGQVLRNLSPLRIPQS